MLKYSDFKALFMNPNNTVGFDGLIRVIKAIHPETMQSKLAFMWKNTPTKEQKEILWMVFDGLLQNNAFDIDIQENKLMLGEGIYLTKYIDKESLQPGYAFNIQSKNGEEKTIFKMPIEMMIDFQNDVL